jgi:hypothetical protein
MIMQEEKMRPWKKVFDPDIRELEAEWLRSLDTAGLEKIPPPARKITFKNLRLSSRIR